MGYETRPVTAFYGLSQFGRAISAAIDHGAIDGSSGWQLSGHGIKVPSLSQIAARGSLADLTLRDQGKGSFTQLAAALQSSSLPNATPLPAIWNCIPEARENPLELGLRYPALDLSEGHDETGEHVGDWGPPRVVRITGVPNEVRDIDEFLSHYPAIWPASKEVSKHPPSPRFGRQGEIYLNTFRGYKVGGFSVIHGTAYRDRNMIFPLLPGNSELQHPLLSWWAVLYALSMLARYEPAGWAKIIDVDSSREAVPVECLLDAAIDAIPSLVASTLKETSRSEHEQSAANEKLEKMFREEEYRTFAEIARSGYAKLGIRYRNWRSRETGPGGRNTRAGS
jgi:hypothetical protein